MPTSLPDPSGFSLLAVFAHPDAESLACGGLLAMCAASASAFAPNTPSFRNNALRMSEEAVEEVAAEPEEEVVEAPPAPAGPVKVPLSGKSPFPDIFLGESVWDKLTMEWGSEETGKFIRAAELKHGRSAMLATVGYSFHKLGLTFDKISVHEYLSPTQDIKFADLAAMSPVDAMKSLPAESWLQMFAFCGIIEIYEMTHVGGKIAYDERV